LQKDGFFRFKLLIIKGLADSARPAFPGKNAIKSTTPAEISPHPGIPFPDRQHPDTPKGRWQDTDFQQFVVICLAFVCRQGIPQENWHGFK